MVVVSLASMGSRLHQLEQTLRSLLAQTRQPDAILVHVSEEPHLADPGVSPRALRESVPAIEDSKGLVQTHFVANTGSYRKIFPALLRVSAPDAIIVTVDDDVLYTTTWLERLVDRLDQPNTITAYRCRKIATMGRHLLPYEDWPFLRSPEDDPLAINASHWILPTGSGGIAYRRSFFTDDDPFSELMRLAPMQDDIALRFLMVSKDIRVRWVPSVRREFRNAKPAQANTGTTLYQHNKRTSALGFTPNDVAIRKVASLLIARAPTPETRELLMLAARGLPVYKALYQQARRRYWALARKP